MAIIGNPIVSTDFPKDTFSGNGSTTAFTMSIAPASVNAVIVVVSGITQDPSTYTISGTTLTFSAAPPTGTSNISVRHLGVAGTPQVPALASVGLTQLSATGTPSSSKYLRGDNTWASVAATTPAGSNNYVQYNSSGSFGSSVNFQYGDPTLFLLTPSTGTVNLLNFYMTGARAADNRFGIVFSDSSSETNAAIWARQTGSNNAADIIVGTNNGTGGASGIASTTEQLRISSGGVLSFNSGYGSSAPAYGTRAWVNFNGTGTVAIRASGNVSSITDNGTGDYTINLTTAMPDVNYSAVGMSQAAIGAAYNRNMAGPCYSAPTTTTFRVQCSDAGTKEDPTYAHIVFNR